MPDFTQRLFTASLLLIGLLSCIPVSRGLSQEATRKTLETFLSEHCYDCHDDTTTKGKLNLLDLELKPTAHANFTTWERIYDRVRTGEMPPKKKPQPEEQNKERFLQQLKKPLLAADLKLKKEQGRVQVRRLTRREYEYTIHDLLGIDLPLREFLPEDQSTHGFETVASGQQFSHYNLASFLKTADMALEEAFGRATRKEEFYKADLTPVMLTKQYRGNYRGPELRNGKSIAWPISLQFYGRMYATEVPKTGWYRITLKDVQAVNPIKDTVWGTLRSGSCFSNEPILFHIANIEATKEKRNLTYEAWIREGHMLEFKPNDVTLKRAPTGAKGGNVSYKGRNLVEQGFQGISISGIRIERIYPNAKKWELRNKLMAGIKKEDLAGLQEAKTREQTFLRILSKFANRAFRRPVSNEQVKPYVDLALTVMQDPDKKPIDGLRNAYRAILCSPRFLTLVEPPGRLDDHALASRLSYTLWDSMPDQQLRTLADQGKLNDSKIFHAQIKRMLDDPKSQRFIISFTDQWLNLKEIDFTAPDRRLYRTFDSVVQNSMLEETRSFVREMIMKNYPINHFIDSDFAFLNERLARFYGMKDLDLVPGKGLQKVSLGENSRGGLITQGAVLKVTANGTTTSPVVRGVWVSERILGMEIPPPPSDVPAVEPDIRGAVSIRDQLDKHRDSESCAACHNNIDPAGFALENYDPVGLWRQKYGNKKTSARVDASGVTPEGDTFKDIFAWKKIYLAKSDMLTHGFARQLLTYATGASPRFSDRDSITTIVEQARAKDYSMRSIVHAVLGSEVFKNK